MVKMFDTTVKAGQNRSSAGIALGEWLLSAWRLCGASGMCASSWRMCCRLRRPRKCGWCWSACAIPSIACCWDVFNAALIGESPYVSVPTLNSRIQYTQVKDAQIGPLGATYCKLGEGDVPVKKFLTRLRGIGYEGWVTFEWEKAWLPGIAGPEESPARCDHEAEANGPTEPEVERPRRRTASRRLSKLFTTETRRAQKDHEIDHAWHESARMTRYIRLRVSFVSFCDDSVQYSVSLVQEVPKRAEDRGRRSSAFGLSSPRSLTWWRGPCGELSSPSSPWGRPRIRIRPFPHPEGS